MRAQRAWRFEQFLRTETMAWSLMRIHAEISVSLVLLGVALQVGSCAQVYCPAVRVVGRLNAAVARVLHYRRAERLLCRLSGGIARLPRRSCRALSDTFARMLLRYNRVLEHIPHVLV